MSGITHELKAMLEKIQKSTSYDDFCEKLGEAIHQKIHSEEITDFKFGEYIAEAILTNDADKVFGAFTGLSAEAFLEKNLLIPNESNKYHDEICEATFVSVWDGGIELETECKVDTKTRRVFDIEDSGINPNSVESLDEEYIILDDIKMPVYKKDDLYEDDTFSFWYEE